MRIKVSDCPTKNGDDDDFVSQDGQSRTIRQFQFTDWPEQGVPKSGEGFIDFIGQVHKTKEQFGQDGPISVHCRYVNWNRKPILVGNHVGVGGWKKRLEFELINFLVQIIC